MEPKHLKLLLKYRRPIWKYRRLIWTVYRNRKPILVAAGAVSGYLAASFAMRWGHCAAPAGERPPVVSSLR